MLDSITSARLAALTVAVLGAVVLGGVGSAALAADCPTVKNPQGIETSAPNQLDRPDYEKQIGHKLELHENPLFASLVKSGKLAPVEERVPEEALVYLPYEDCGRYGGILRGLSLALESGTSEFLSWRQVNLVRLSDDLQTLVPNVAKSWKWNGDYSQITFTLRKGHKWSDGAPFTADDVVFYIDDIIKNQDIHPTVPGDWVVQGKPVEIEKIDDLTFTLKFGGPYPGFLHYLATGGSFFAPYAPKHFYMKYHAKYNADADAEAKAAGHESWVKRFQLIWHKWKDAETIPPLALERPTLESHVLELETDTQRRQFVANPYYFKVDSAGNQLPYIDRQHERFLDHELFVLSIINGEVDQKAQNVGLSNYPVLKENEAKGGYKVLMPPYGPGPIIAFNQTHPDAVLREIYGDARFRTAMSLAINRGEINEVLWFGLGRPQQALPLGVSFVTDENRNYMIDYDPAQANALLDEMGLKRGADGLRLRADGKPLTILWEYTTQATGGSSEFVTLLSDYWKAVGVNVLPKEVTTQLTRERATANQSDINMEWDTPYEPNLISQISLYIPPYSDISPLLGVPWRDWLNSQGAQGEEPPAWVKELYALADEWKTVLPGSDRYKEIGRRMVEINQKEMTLIGTIADLPGPTVVKDSLRNVTAWTVQHYNYGRTYPFRPDQWYYAE